MIVAGAALYFWCVYLFAAVGRGTPGPWDAPRTVVAVGPYLWVRNPIYLGALAVVLGEAALFGSLALVAYAAVMTACFAAFVLGYESPRCGAGSAGHTLSTPPPSRAGFPADPGTGAGTSAAASRAPARLAAARGPSPMNTSGAAPFAAEARGSVPLNRAADAAPHRWPDLPCVRCVQALGPGRQEGSLPWSTQEPTGQREGPNGPPKRDVGPQRPLTLQDKAEEARQLADERR
jgi:hypothetical protein